jgi:hypothetical protein
VNLDFIAVFVRLFVIAFQRVESSQSPCPALDSSDTSLTGVSREAAPVVEIGGVVRSFLKNR